MKRMCCLSLVPYWIGVAALLAVSVVDARTEPPPTISICSDCPPPYVESPSPQLREPVFPTSDGGGNPGDCLVCVCFYWVWDFPGCGVPPDVEPGGEPGQEPDPGDPGHGCPGTKRLVIEMTDSRSCNTSQVGFMCNGPGLCVIVSLPCLDLDADGECSFTEDDPDDTVDKAIDKILADNVDPTAIEHWNLYRDGDGDGLPNAIDHDFEIFGPPINPDGTVNEDYTPFNPFAPIPADAEMVDAIFADNNIPLPAGYKPSDLLPTDPAAWGDGDLVMADLVPHLINGLLAAKNDAIADLVAASIAFFAGGSHLGSDLHSAYEEAIEEELDAFLDSIDHLEEFLLYLGPGFAGSLDEYNMIAGRMDELIDPVDDFIADQHEVIDDLINSPSYQRLLRNLERINEASKDALVGKIGDGESATDLAASLAIRVVFSKGSLILEPVFVDADGETFEVDPGETTELSVEAGTSRADPVSTSTGAFRYEHTDFALPGRGLNLELTRYYDSRELHLGATGRNFSMPLVETRLQIVPGLDWRLLVLQWGDGRMSHFVLNEDPDTGESFYQGIAGEYGKIRLARPDGSDEPGCSDPVLGFILREPSGVQWYFCPPTTELGAGGYLTCWLRKVSDLHGNALVIQRDDYGRCTHLIDTLYRTTTFDYLNDRERIIRKITRPDGGEIDYTYDLRESDSGFFNYDLLRVEFPETIAIDDSETVIVGRPWLEYDYSESGEGFEANPEGVTNHNLLNVASSAGGIVDVSYYDTGDYQHDRVQSVTVDGKVTQFRWTELTPTGPDAYGQEPVHLCEVRLPDGELEKFYHDVDSHLVRREVAVFRDLDGDFAPDYSDPTGANAYLTLYEYDPVDTRVLARTTTTDVDFPSGPRRRTEWTYNSEAADRFHQGLITEVRTVASTTDDGVAPERVETRTYDPVTVALRTRSDAIGRTTNRTFVHQEPPSGVIEDLFGVAGWGIDLSTTAWNVGDVNGDGEIGGIFPLGSSSTGVFAEARLRYPDVPVAAPSGPATPVTTTPEELRRYNRFGQPTDTRSPEGLWTRYVYDGGHVASVTQDATDGPAVVQSFEYDTFGHLIRSTEPDGRAVEYRYDGWDNLIEVAEFPSVPDGVEPTEKIVRRTFFDLAGFERGVTDAQLLPADADSYQVGDQPQLVRWSHYLPHGKVASVERRAWFQGYAQTSVTAFTYDGQERIHTEIDAEGGLRRRVYDTRGAVVAIEQHPTDGGAMAVQQFEYDPLGNLVETVAAVDSDGNGENDRTTYEVNGYGEQIGTVSALGVRTELDVDGVGRVTEHRTYDAQGVLVARTTQEYDAIDRIQRTVISNFIIDPQGNVLPATPAQRVVENGWGLGDGELLWVAVDPDGLARLTRHEYDSLGRRIATWEGATEEVGETTQYDIAGRVTHHTTYFDGDGRIGPVSPSASVLVSTYDAFGRLSSETRGLDGATIYEHDANGALIAEVDPSGLRTEYDCDSAGRCWARREGVGTAVERAIEFAYDTLDRLTGVIDASGAETQYHYDGFGRLAARVLPDQHEILYTNDRRGRVVAIEEGGDLGTLVEIAYDAADRPIAINATGADADVSRLMVYDALGRVVIAAEQVGTGEPVTISRAHDASDHVIAERQQIGSLVDRVSLASYDGAGRLEDVLYPTGWVMRRTRDDLGRLTSLVLNPGSSGHTVAQYADPYGFLGYRQVQLTNDARIERDFDSSGRTSRLDLLDGAGQVLHGVSIGRNEAGDVVERTRSVDEVRDELSYDALRRLVTYAHDVDGITAGQRTLEWNHTAADDWSESSDDSRSPAIVAPEFNSLHQYLVFDPFDTIHYDAKGQERERQTVTGQTTTTWDALGRPLTTTVNDGVSATVFWIYDALDRLAARFVSPGDYTRWTHLGDLLVESDSSGVLQSYADGPHGIYRFSNVDERYLHVDPFANVTAVHDTVSVLEEYDYDPYGSPRDPQTGAIVTATAERNELLFLAKPYDFVTGLVRTRHRHYDPELGRFIRRDPLGEGGGLNLYAYANQNPLTYFDPSGLAGEKIEAGPKAAVPGGARLTPAYLIFRSLEENSALDHFHVFHHVDTADGRQEILDFFADSMGVEASSIDNFTAAQIFGVVRDNNLEVLNGGSGRILSFQEMRNLRAGVSALEDHITFLYTYEANELFSAVPGWGILNSITLAAIDIKNGDYQKALYRAPDLVPGVKAVKAARKVFKLGKTAFNAHKTAKALKALKITTSSLVATHQIRNENVIDAIGTVVGASELGIEAQIGAGFLKAEAEFINGNFESSGAGLLKTLVGQTPSAH